MTPSSVMFSVTDNFFMLIPPLWYLTLQEDRNHRLNGQEESARRRDDDFRCHPEGGMVLA
jgi:hypothetical protein